MKTEIRTLETVAAKGRLLGLDMVYHCASGHGGFFFCHGHPDGSLF